MKKELILELKEVRGCVLLVCGFEFDLKYLFVIKLEFKIVMNWEFVIK